MIASPLLLALLAGACSFDEQLPEIDIHGTVVVPREAATRTFTDEQGGTYEVTDVRFIGPVYLGAYSGISRDLYDYPHPLMGPVVNADYPGNTFPYGGTSVGRFSFACYPSVACRVVTGRFASFDDILEYFRDYVREPVTDPQGREVTSAEVYEQYCYDYYYATDEQEFTFLAVDEDGKPDLDFTENEDGDFVAEFTMRRTRFVEGMQVWGWVDNPSADSFRFSTCDEDRPGPNSYEYDLDFEAGGPYHDILNYPSLYIYEGDWVVGEAFEMDSPDDEPVLTVDFRYE